MKIQKTTICLTDKMHKIADWIYYKHDISLAQLARTAFKDEDLLLGVKKESLKAYGQAHFRTTLILPEETVSVIDSIAANKSMSRSAVIRYVLYHHMQKYNPNSQNAHKAVA